MTAEPEPYAARLQIDYPEHLDRLTTFFRLIWIIPIGCIFTLLTASGGTRVVTETGRTMSSSGGGIVGGLAMATALMILFRQRYPRWWFDFARELARFGTRVGAYLVLLTDTYPSTVDEQSVHLEIDYPDVERELNRWLPLVKWLLAIPHVIVLVVLMISPSSSSSSPGSRSSSPGSTREGCSTTWWVWRDGRFGSRRMLCCSSPTAIRPSA